MEIKKEPELELDELGLNEMGDDTEQEDIIDSTPHQTIIDADPHHDTLSLKTLNGFELSLSSIRFNVFDLGNLALQLYENFLENKPKNNGRSYLG